MASLLTQRERDRDKETAAMTSLLIQRERQGDSSDGQSLRRRTEIGRQQQSFVS